MENILKIDRICKSFPGVNALKNVSLNIKKGDVHVLVGENGAGKSTLVKVIHGDLIAETGKMTLDGKNYLPLFPADGHANGIKIVYQEFNLLPYMTVMENIFLSHFPHKYGVVNKKKLYEMTEELIELLGINIKPSTIVENLGIAQKQLVEIAKALSEGGKILILDEPTATLTSKEIDKLFQIIDSLQKQGLTIIYISHRLQETKEIGNAITIMRNGEIVMTSPISNLSIPQIVKLMVGRSISAELPFYDEIKPQEETVLEVKNLNRGIIKDVSFKLRKSEILGIAGLVGSGRTETARLIFGADKIESGKIFLNGKEVVIKSPRDSIKKGIGLLTEDRKGQGLMLEMEYYKNVTITNLPKTAPHGLLNPNKEKSDSMKYIDKLSIQTPSIMQKLRNFSGGNQQKVVLAKWLYRDVNILIMDEPTRGIDVGAKYEMYNLFWQIVKQRHSVIFISSDIYELIGICHRIIVFSDGRIAGEVERKDFDNEKILNLAYKYYLKKEL